MDFLLRTRALIGQENLDKLKKSTVMVLGIGGVGSTCAEALCRSGVGKLILVDKDNFDITNVNRQLFATLDSVDKSKVLTAKNRLKTINPECEIVPLQIFYLPDNAQELFVHEPDFIVDAIDTVTSKLDLMQQCYERKIPLVSSMGTGNRLDPTKFVIDDISKTAGCGCNLAKVIRRELKKRNVPKQQVLYSTEVPQKIGFVGDGEHGRHSPASIAFVPPVAGYALASYVVRQIIEKNTK